MLTIEWSTDRVAHLLERLRGIESLIATRAATQRILDEVSKACAEFLGGECVVGIRLLDNDDPGLIRLVSASGLPLDAIRSASPVPADRGLAGRALATGEIAVADDHVTIDLDAGAIVNDPTLACVAAPLHLAGRIVGVLEAASLSAGRTFQPNDEQILRIFAEHATLALNGEDASETVRRANADIVHQATHDALTDLPNRSLVLDRLTFALHRAKRSQHNVTVLFVDIDRFKTVNEIYGHAFGDAALVEIAQRLQTCVRPADTVGRLGGDEFVVICEQVPERHVMDVAERIADSLSDPIEVDGRETTLHASIGVAHAGSDETAQEIIWNADIAMYRAKEQGVSRVMVFDDEMRARITHRVATEQRLRHALERDEMRLHYQPAWFVPSTHMLGTEALLRWWRDDELVLPGAFIPLLEETGLIIPIGQWAITEACHQAAEWRRGDDGLANLQMSVNLSVRQFTDPALVDHVAEALRASGLPADCLWLEITETTAMDDVGVTANVLAALKELGVQLALDDFGTGYSSLAYLKDFPVDVVKIDRTFVESLGDDAGSEAIVTAIVHLSRALGIEVMAEGVETTRQLAILRRLGCHVVQGFLLGRPEPPETVVTTLLDKWRLADRPDQANDAR